MEPGTIRLRAFVEGVEVPCVSAVCSAGVGGRASASIQVVPADAALELYPRSLVHLFFYDDAENVELSALKQDEFDQKELENVDLALYLPNERYKLLFAGELYITQYSQSFNSRSVVLQCQDFSTYWEAARALFVSGKSTSSKTKAMAYSSGAVLRYDKADRKPYEFILDLLLKQKSVQHPDVQGVMGGLLLLLEYIGGVSEGKDKFRGLNDFFSQAELRLHLSRMTGTAKDDDTSKLLLGTKGFRKMFKRALSSMGNSVSFSDIIEMVLKQIQSYTSPVLAPMYRRKTLVAYDVKKTSSVAVDIGAAATDRLTHLESVRTKALQLASAISSVLGAEGGGMSALAVMGTGNVGNNPVTSFPETHSFGERLALFASAADAEYATSKEADIAGTSPITAELLADPRLAVAAQLDQKVVILAKAMAIRVDSPKIPGQNYPAINLGNLTEFKTRVAAAIKEYKKAKIKSSTVTKTVSGASAPWLFTHIISPELFLCAPPQCNVLFPEHISNLSFTKEWSKEITRLHLTTRKEWEAEKSAFQRQQYISPAISTADKLSAAGQFEKGRSFIYPHEIFTGIIPKYDQVPRVPAYKKLAKKQGEAVGDDYQLDKVDYLQRIANFLFIKYRIGPRTMQLGGKFNPRPVVGMPAMVIPNLPNDDEIYDAVFSDAPEAFIPAKSFGNAAYTDPQALIDIYAAEYDKWVFARENSPKIHSGLLHSIIHSVTQDGGQTRYTVTHLWDPYNEEVPGMGNFEVKVPGPTTTKVTTKHNVSLAKIQLDGEKAKSDGKLADAYAHDPDAPLWLKTVQDFNKSVASSTKEAAAQVPSQIIKPKLDAKGNSNQWTGPKGGKVTDVVFSDVKDLGLAIAEGDPEAGDGRWLVTRGTATVKITESYTPYTRKKLGEIPFEYAVRPPWLGKSYTNTRIGSNFYLPLLGCFSICDHFKTLNYSLVMNTIQQIRATAAGTDTPSQEALEAEPLIQSMIQDFVTGNALWKAADGLIRAYAQNRKLGRPGTVNRFLEAFTERPIATLNDILGSSDLRYNEDGKVFAGREGFHSRAFGVHTDYALLENPSLKQYDGTGVLRKLDPKTDPRKPRRLVAEKYQEQLLAMSASATKRKKV